MIINLNCLQDVYPEIPIETLDDVLIDTWFIDENPRIYESIFRYSQTPNFSDSNVVKVIKNIQNSAKFLYNHFEINTLNLSYLYPPQNIVDHIGKLVNPEMWRHTYTFENLIVNKEKKWDDLDCLFSDHNNKEWGELFLGIDCDLFFLNNQKILENRVFSQAMRIQIGDERNSPISSVSKSEIQGLFYINIKMKFWSLLKEDNREDIMMIYLCHFGLLKSGTTRNQEIISTLLEIGELHEIAEQAQKFGLIEVTQDEYDFYECSIMVIPYRNKLYLRDNRELAEINRPIFLNFIEKFEQGFKPESRNFFPVWL